MGFDIGDIMYIIDRIEDNIAVCEKEDGSMTKIPVSIIKGKIEEGAIIVRQGEFFLVDKEQSIKRKKEIDDLMKGMWSYE